MPPRAPWPTRCSTAFADEQIVSALELKLRTLKQRCEWNIGVSTLHFRLNRRLARRGDRNALAIGCAASNKRRRSK